MAKTVLAYGSSSDGGSSFDNDFGPYVINTGSASEMAAVERALGVVQTYDAAGGHVVQQVTYTSAGSPNLGDKLTPAGGYYANAG